MHTPFASTPPRPPAATARTGAPAAPPRPESAPPPAADLGLRTGKWLRDGFNPGDAVILIVDDEPTVLDMMKIYLADAGYRRFVTSTDPTQTMELLESSDADAVFLDVVMPRVSGLELLARIRGSEIHAHVPVLVLTSSTDPETKQQALELGASDFLAKPVDPSELLLRLRNVLAAKAYHDRLAFMDEVTGLPNRRHFVGRLKRTVAHAGHAERTCALLHVGLDRFRKINDGLGHAAANAVLRAVSERMARHVGSGEPLGESNGRVPVTLARVGGSEFAVLCPDVECIESVRDIAERVRDAVAEPVTVGRHELRLAASVGVATYPGDGADAEDLFTNAGRAMHYARENGDARVIFYGDDIESWSSEQMQLETDLRHALESDALELRYQPKVDFASGRIVGVEALLRWTHPERGVISPARFIPLAEEAGLIEGIGSSVLRAACIQAEAWRRAGIPALGVAVNVSTLQLQGEGLISVVNGALSASGLPAEQLTLELTESAIMVDAAESVRVLGALKSLGVRLSVDDFGTGYSSLAYLKRFPLDELKIDRSFVKDIPDDEDDVAIVTAVIVLAQSLGLKLVAEGVETEAQRRFLEAKGCDAYQGYLFARPLPPDEVEALAGASTARPGPNDAVAVLSSATPR